MNSASSSRRALTAEQSSIDDRLAEIAAERAKLTPPSLFPHIPRRIDNLMAMRAGGADMRPALEKRHQSARRVDRPHHAAEDAKAIAARVARAGSNDEARAILKRPSPGRARSARPCRANRRPCQRPCQPCQLAASPRTWTSQDARRPASDVALQADAEGQLARLAAEKKGNVLIPVGVDDKGEPIVRSLANMLDEAKSDRAAAAQLKPA